MKKLATLNVYLDTKDEDKDMPVSGVKKELDGSYTLLVKPQKDGPIMRANLGYNENTLSTIIAHELGHFVALLTKDVTHEPFFKHIVGPVPGEQTAWNIAKMIKPDLDTRVEDYALRAYSHKLTEQERGRLANVPEAQGV